MRPISPKHAKGLEPPRTLADDFRVLRYIVSAGWHYAIAGQRVRREWRASKRHGDKYYVDEE